MNILIYYIKELYPHSGGVERVSCNLAQEFMSRGHKVTFLIKKRVLSKVEKTICDMCSLETKDFSERDILYKIENVIQENKIDIILNQDFFDLKFMEIINKNFSVPVITAYHTRPVMNINELKPAKGIFKDSVIKSFVKTISLKYRYNKKIKHENNQINRMLKNSSKLVFLSKSFVQDVIDCMSIEESKKNKIISISNFTDLKVDYTCNLNDKKKIVLFVGRLSYEKNVGRLISVWENLYSKYPDWSLRIAGDGPQIEDLKEYIKNKQMKNIEFLGFVDTSNEYKKASIICMTSNFEGFPMVLLESTMYGCVPMAFNSFSSIYDIIDDNKNGIIVEAYDIKKYQRKLNELISNENYRLNMQNQALRINFKLNKEKIVEQWLKLFEEVVNDRRSHRMD